MIFDNPQIASHDLPQIEQIDFIKLEKDYLKVLIIYRMIFLVLAFIGLLALYFFPPEEFQMSFFYFGMGSWLVVFIASMILIPMAFRIKGYAQRFRDLVYRSGLIVRTTTALPFNRVQHVDVKQGPIERMFDLASLNIYTAGGQSSDVSIPGLKNADALKLKEYILKRTLDQKEYDEEE